MSSEQEQPEDYTQGYYVLPRVLRAPLMASGINTIRLVQFFADVTMGWHSRWAALTYDEMLNGRKKANGERMEPGSGIPNDGAITKAIQDALQAGFIEVIAERGQTFYAIHRRYWARGKIKPMWILFKRITWSQERDPLVDDLPAASQGVAQPLESYGSAITRLADSYADASSQLSPGKQPVIEKIAQPLREASLQAARQDAINTSLDTSGIDTSRIDTVAASPIGSPPSISKSEKEEHQDVSLEAAEAPEQPAPLSEAEQAQAAEEARQRQEEAARRAEAEKRLKQAEQEKQRKAREEQEEKDRAITRLLEKRDNLIRAKQKAEQGSDAWNTANEQLKALKAQLQEAGWYL